MDKVRKYTWILLCAALAVWHAYMLIGTGGAIDLSWTINAWNLALVLVFTTALLHELKANKTVLTVMVGLSLIACIYTAFFAKFLG